MNYRYRNLTLSVGGVSNGTTESMGPDLGRQILIHSISAQMYATTVGDYFRIISYGCEGSENEIISLRAYVANQLLTWNAPCYIWLEPDQRFYMQRDLQAVGSGLNVSVLYSVEDAPGSMYSMEPSQAQQCDPWARLMGRC